MTGKAADAVIRGIFGREKREREEMFFVFLAEILENEVEGKRKKNERQ